MWSRVRRQLSQDVDGSRKSMNRTTTSVQSRANNGVTAKKTSAKKSSVKKTAATKTSAKKIKAFKSIELDFETGDYNCLLLGLEKFRAFRHKNHN